MNPDFNCNEDWMKKLLSEKKQQLNKINQGSGKVALEKQKERKQLCAREPIADLMDCMDIFIEIGAFAGFGMYEAEGGCSAGGTVSMLGHQLKLLLWVVNKLLKLYNKFKWQPFNQKGKKSAKNRKRNYLPAFKKNTTNKRHAPMRLQDFG